MSGNSSESRRTTSPIRTSLPVAEAVLIAGAPAPARAKPAPPSVGKLSGTSPPCQTAPSSLRRSSLHEGQAVLTDLHLVPVLELDAVDAPAVDEGAVQRALVLDEELAVALDQHGVVAGDGDVVEE